MTLYTTNCPRCKVLETKLNQSNINYNISNNMEIVINKGFLTAPVLEIDGIFFTFEEALEKIKEL